jgi:hypothetical protein
MNNPLIKLDDGSWIDPKTVAAVRVHPFDETEVLIDRHPPFKTMVVNCGTKERAETCRDNIAAARILAEEPPRVKPSDDYDGDRP